MRLIRFVAFVAIIGVTALHTTPASAGRIRNLFNKVVNVFKRSPAKTMPVNHGVKDRVRAPSSQTSRVVEKEKPLVTAEKIVPKKETVVKKPREKIVLVPKASVPAQVIKPTTSTKESKRPSEKKRVVAVPDKPATIAKYWTPNPVQKKPVQKKPALELASKEVKPLLLPVDPKDPPRSHGTEGGPHWLIGNAKASTTGAKKTLVFFHGGGQRTNNIIIHRLASALKHVGVPVNVVSMPVDGHAARELIMRAPKGSVIVASHSAGGIALDKVVNDKALTEKLAFSVCINSSSPSSGPVPKLYVASKWDFSGSHAGKKIPNVKILPLDSDHSLRYRPGRVGDSAKADYSKDTWNMNLQLAREINAMASK